MVADLRRRRGADVDPVAAERPEPGLPGQRRGCEAFRGGQEGVQQAGEGGRGEVVGGGGG